MVRKSLQIVLMGWEWDRLVYGIKKYVPNKVVLVSSMKRMDEESGQRFESTEKITEKLMDEIGGMIECEKVNTDFMDYNMSLKVLFEIFRRHKDEYDETIINISGGSKLVVAAAVVVSQYFPCKLIYVSPEKYTIDYSREFISRGVNSSCEIDTFDFAGLIAPQKKMRTLFSLIGEDTPVSELTLSFAKTLGRSRGKASLRNLKSLVFYYLKQLEELKLVKSSFSGRSKLVSVTNTGKFVQTLISSEDSTHL